MLLYKIRVAVLYLKAGIHEEVSHFLPGQATIVKRFPHHCIDMLIIGVPVGKEQITVNIEEASYFKVDVLLL